MVADHRHTRSVLFVDDEADERRLYADYFDRRSDISPVTAESASNALNELARRTVDCVVTDSVAVDDGEPLVEVLAHRHPDTPVLLYSGQPATALPVEAGDSYLQKTANAEGETSMETLHRCINELLGRQPTDTDDGANEWRYLGTFDPEAADTITTGVLEALGERTGLDIAALPPLYGTIDADALGRLLAHAAEAQTDGVEARFPVADYQVRVCADGYAEYRQREGASTACE